MRRHGYEQRVVASGYAGSHLRAAHLGHLYVYEEHVRTQVGKLPQCFVGMAACRYVPSAARNAREHLAQKLQLQAVVVNNQYADPVGRHALRSVSGLSAGACRPAFGCRSLVALHAVAVELKRKRHMKRCALALGRLERDAPSEQSGQLAGYRQAQAHALGALRSGQTREGVEYAARLLGRHSASRVGHIHLQAAALHARRYGYAAMVGVFKGVAYYVVEYLLYAEGVAQTQA